MTTPEETGQYLTAQQEQERDLKLWNEAVKAREEGATAVAAEDFTAPKEGAHEEPQGEKPAGEEPAGETPQGEQQGEQPQGSEKPQKEEKPDPLERITAQMAEINRNVDDLRNAVRTTTGRVASLQSEMAKAAKDAAERAKQRNERAPTDKQIEAAVKNPELWENFKKDFPELGDATEALLNNRIAGLQGGGTSGEALEQLQKQMKELQDGLTSRTSDSDGTLTPAQQAALDVIKSDVIELRHTGWQDTVKTKEFEQWLYQQPQATRVLAESDRPIDAIRLLDHFEEHRKAIKAAADLQARRNNRLRSATTPQGASPQRTIANPDDQTDEEIWNQEAQKRDRENART